MAFEEALLNGPEFDAAVSQQNQPMVNEVGTLLDQLIVIFLQRFYHHLNGFFPDFLGNYCCALLQKARSIRIFILCDPALINDRFQLAEKMAGTGRTEA
jgi:hypothetical protein